MERIVSDLKAFDQPRRHVMLDARVVVMERGDLLNLGIQWDWPGISAGTFSDSELHGGGATERVNWPWGIQIGYTPGREFTNSLLLTLNLLNQNDDATVVASPQLLAQDGQQAEIKVATEEYFKITEESYYYTRFELETIETGTTLTITPSIGDNNEITLEITTEVSDVIARGEDNLPIVTRRTTKNTVRIEDGGTAAIAGLMDSRTRLQKIQAPGLADIPIFGELFRNTSRQRSSRQVAVFVTARLMPETGRLRREPVEDRAPIELVGEEFRTALQEILSRLRRGDEKP
jgi:type II secretory pathway component GspD/PulD (secretin)